MTVAGQPFASQRLHAIAAELKAQGERGLKRRMNSTLRAAAVPLVDAVREAAREKLPKKGGLNEQQAEQAIRVMVLSGARTAGVRIRTSTRGSMQTDKGFVRHPVFGEWKPNMPSQQIPQATGWWSYTLYRKSPEVTPLILAEMNRVARQIQGGL